MYMDFGGIYLWTNRKQSKARRLEVWERVRHNQKKINNNPYIPTSVPGPPNILAAVPKKWNKKLGQQNTMQDDDEQKKKALPFSDKLKMIDHMHTHQLTQKQAANYWAENGYRGRVSQKNISIWVKNEDCMQEEVMQGGAKGATHCIRGVKFPKLEAALTLWVEGCEALLQPITGPLIVAKAEQLRDVLNLLIDAIRFSHGWINKFKRCYALHHYQSHSEAGSVNLTSVKEECMRMWHKLQGWDLNVLNVDEMSFFQKSIQNNGLLTRGLPGRKLDKMRMSVLVMMTATGTEKIHLLFIATVKKQQCFGKKEG